MSLTASALDLTDERGVLLTIAPSQTNDEASSGEASSYGGTDVVTGADDDAYGGIVFHGIELVLSALYSGLTNFSVMRSLSPIAMYLSLSTSPIR